VSRYDEAKRYFRRGYYADAADAFEEWLLDYPKSELKPAALYHWAQSQLHAGQKEKAKATYERLAKDYADTGWGTFAREELATIDAKAPKPLGYGRRPSWWRPGKWIAAKPRIVREFESARADYREGRYEKALAAFRGLANGNPQSPLAPASWYWVALCYERLGQTDKARKIYQTITTTYPNTEWEKLAQEDLRRLKST